MYPSCVCVCNSLCRYVWILDNNKALVIFKAFTHHQLMNVQFIVHYSNIHSIKLHPNDFLPQLSLLFTIHDHIVILSILSSSSDAVVQQWKYKQCIAFFLPSSSNTQVHGRKHMVQRDVEQCAHVALPVSSFATLRRSIPTFLPVVVTYESVVKFLCVN